MDKDYLILKRASVSRSSGQWSDDDFDVLAEGVVVGRIFKANDEATPRGGYGCVRQRAGGANDLQAAGELRRQKTLRAAARMRSGGVWTREQPHAMGPRIGTARTIMPA